MSTDDRSTEIKQAVRKFIISMVIIGAFFLAIVVLYVRGSGKLAIEYVEKNKAAEHFQDQLIDVRGAVKELHLKLDSTNNVNLQSRRRADSMQEVTERQTRTIKNLRDENHNISDSLQRFTKRVKVFDLSPGND